jgi:16S rRNA (cytosine1402-N4)-methyltransferase
MGSVHKPVLLQEVIESLQVKPGALYIDATFGGGGHSLEILKHGGHILGIDQDPEAIVRFEQNGQFAKAKTQKDIQVVKGNFKDIEKIAQENGFEKVAGILFDLGLSSDQLDVSGRGFTLRYDEPLDMRMDMTSSMTAEEIINTWSEDELYELFIKMGEERNARLIAQKIIKVRKESPITTTGKLVIAIEEVTKTRGKIHPATQVFMALRIAVNNELEVLKNGLHQAFNLLEPKGRMAVISFHSLEDRIVKITFKHMEEQGLGKIITKKPLVAGEQETVENRRARSAKLRVFEKI